MFDSMWVQIADAIVTSGRNYDTDKIRRAFDLAAVAHQNQKRKSGEPYLVHPVAVAIILIEFGMDADTIAAALLHDVVEDTAVTLEELTKQFGEEIARLVDGVTKLGRLPLSTKEEEQAENVRKMLLAMAQDVRVIIIKLADRLHNMRTIEFMSPQKQRDIALETMEVYTPIAHRLGIRTMKEELEDRAFRILDPVAYREIENSLDIQRSEREGFLEKIIKRIHDRMEEEHYDVYLAGRVKSIYGIYRKVFIQGRSFEEIYDIFAVRIIVDTVIECYNCLGVIHDMFRPIPNRFKDYISTPKANMYQSLHTTVIDKEGIPFEVQIRTWEMHQTAEYGIAAHWKYKAGIQGRDKLEERLAWVRQLLEAQQDSADVEDIVRTIKSDLAPEEVYVFTPKGDVKNLPTGSTVIDFAYSIHSAVGNRMVGAKVDGRIVPLDYVVRTGQIVEVITTNAQGHGPSRDWLKIVKTSEARNKIRAWFKKERKEENIAQGKEELDREFKRNYISLTDEQYQEFVDSIAKRQHFSSAEELYASIGYGGTLLSRIMPRIKDDYNKTYRTEAKAAEPQKPRKISTTSHDVVVEGIDNCLVKFARCCNPLPGDDIIGFVTRGYGVSIHKSDCVNVRNTMKDPAQQGRFIAAHWSDHVTETFKATVEITAEDREGLLARVSVHLANMRIAIYELNARTLKGGLVAITITLGAQGTDHLNRIIAEFRKLDGILSVERTNR